MLNLKFATLNLAKKQLRNANKFPAILQFLSLLWTEKILCLDFSNEVPAPIESVLRVTRYRDGLQSLLHKLKFDNNLNVLPALKKILDDVANRKEMLKLLEIGRASCRERV